MRLFPRDHSLTADEQGEMDVFAILVANQPMNYPTIDQRMKENKAGGIAKALPSVLGAELLPEDAARYTAGETFGTQAPASHNALALIIEVEKR
jgi:hypothetical protein